MRRGALVAVAAALIAIPSPATPPAGASDVPGARCTAVVATAYSCRVLVDENPLMKSTGMVIYHDEDEHFLYSADVLRATIFRIDLDILQVDRITNDFEPPGEMLLGAHTPELDARGRLYVTEYFGAVRRMNREGKERVPIAVGTSHQRDDDDRVTGTSGIAFNSQGRLFVGDNIHDRDYNEHNDLGRLYEIDPQGLKPARVIQGWVEDRKGDAIPEGLGQVEEISFVPEDPERAYVTDPDGNRVNVINVDTGAIERRLTGFDRPYGNEYDPNRKALLISEYSGNLWEVDPHTGARRLLARSDRPLASMAIDPDPEDGTVYVSNGIYGGLWRLDESVARLDERLVPVLAEGWFAIPTSLNDPPAGAALAPGSLWVGDWTGISSVAPDGTVTRAVNFDADDYNPLNRDDPQWLSPSALQYDDTTVYFSETGFFQDRISRLDLRTGKRETVTKLGTGKDPDEVFGPYHVRLGPGGDLLVSEQQFVPTKHELLPGGRILRVDPETGATETLLEGLQTPGGLRYDVTADLAYVSEVATGRIWTVKVSDDDSVERRLVAHGLDAPEGLDLDGAGGLIVVEGEGARRILRFDLDTCRIIPCVPGQAEEIASGLRTKLRGPIPKPLAVDVLADVLVRDDGSIVVTTPEDARLLVFEPSSARVATD